MKPQRITFGRMHPNAGYTAQYRREIRKLIKAMREDTRKEILALYEDGKTQDAKLKKKEKTLVETMAVLRKRWYKIFEQNARKMSRWLAEKVMKRTRKDIMKQLKDIGLAIQPNYSDTEKVMINGIVQNGVDLIKTIPQDYLREVQTIVNEAVVRGGDRHTIWENIKDKFDHPLVNQRAGESEADAIKRAERRAELIAGDQVQKATQEFALNNAQAYGATKGEWIHVPGEKTSRITHIHFDGEVFDLNKGLYDDDVGEYVLPGQLIYCRCTFQAIFPGTE